MIFFLLITCFHCITVVRRNIILVTQWIRQPYFLTSFIIMTWWDARHRRGLFTRRTNEIHWKLPSQFQITPGRRHRRFGRWRYPLCRGSILFKRVVNITDRQWSPGSGMLRASFPLQHWRRNPASSLGRVHGADKSPGAVLGEKTHRLTCW